jgi:hypothetical protein
VGASVLGIGLLRSRNSSGVAAWLLVLGGFPGGVLVGLFVVGHLFGFLFIYDIAWIILGMRLWLSNKHQSSMVRTDLQAVPR